MPSNPNPADNISPNLLNGGIDPNGYFAPNPTPPTEHRILTNLSIVMNLPQPQAVVGGLTTGGTGGVVTDGVQGGASGPYLGAPPPPASQYYTWKNPA